MSEFGNLSGISDGSARLAVSGANDAADMPAAERGTSVAGSADAIDRIMRDPAASSPLYPRVAAMFGDANGGAGRPAISRQILDQTLAVRFGPRLQTVLGALPTALRATFLAQLLETGSSFASTNGQGASGSPAEDARLRSDCAAAVAAESNDAALHLGAARLARYVERYGIDALMALVALPASFSGEANLPALIANALVPPRLNADQRSRRRQDEQRRRRHTEPGPEMDGADEKHGYTIDDLVQFAGEPVARCR